MSSVRFLTMGMPRPVPIYELREGFAACVEQRQKTKAEKGRILSSKSCCMPGVSCWVPQWRKLYGAEIAQDFSNLEYCIHKTAVMSSLPDETISLNTNTRPTPSGLRTREKSNANTSRREKWRERKIAHRAPENRRDGAEGGRQRARNAKRCKAAEHAHEKPYGAHELNVACAKRRTAADAPHRRSARGSKGGHEQTRQQAFGSVGEKARFKRNGRAGITEHDKRQPKRRWLNEPCGNAQEHGFIRNDSRTHVHDARPQKRAGKHAARAPLRNAHGTPPFPTKRRPRHAWHARKRGATMKTAAKCARITLTAPTPARTFTSGQAAPKELFGVFSTAAYLANLADSLFGSTRKSPKI